MRTARHSSGGKMALGAAVALLVAAAALAHRPPNIKYEATAIKRELNATSFYPLIYFIIPDGQCTGVLDSDVIPSWCIGVNGISVIARDRSPLEVDIMNDLQSAVVYRQKNSYGICAGIAAVKMKVSCRDLAANVPPHIRSSANGQNWPEPVKKLREYLHNSHESYSQSNELPNHPSTTENPSKPVLRTYYLRTKINKGQDGPEFVRIQFDHHRHSRYKNLHANERQNWENTAKMQPVPVFLEHSYDFYPHSNEGLDRIIDNPNQRYQSGLISCKK